MNVRGRLGRALAVLLLAALCLTLSVIPVSAEGEGEASQTPTLRYWYDLGYDPSDQPATAGLVNVELHLEHEAGAPFLHTGSIAVGLDATGPVTIKFTSEKYGHVTFQTGFGAPDSSAVGGEDYLGFVWYCKPGYRGLWAYGAAETDELLGTLTIPFAFSRADLTEAEKLEELKAALLLLQFPQTVSGSKLVNDWKSAAPGSRDKRELENLIRGYWRRVGNTGAWGYYQGFYWDVPTPEEESSMTPQERTEAAAAKRDDIGCRWRGGLLRLVSYDQKDEVRLKVYERKELSSGVMGYDEANPPDYTRTIPGNPAGEAGQHPMNIELAVAEYVPSGGGTAQKLPADKTYMLVIEKQSHVRAIFENVTVVGSETFPELSGQRIVLPCGDVDGDGHIGQMDRGKLTRPGRYGKADPIKSMATPDPPEGEPYDLDGDGRVDQRDLAILTAPSNYGKNDIHEEFTIAAT